MEFDKLQGAEKIGLFFVYASGTGGTGVEYIVEVSPVSSDDDWFPVDFGIDAGTPASAVSTATDTEIRHQIAVAVPRVYRWIKAPGAQRLRVRAKELGTVTGAGTLSVRVTAVKG